MGVKFTSHTKKLMKLVYEDQQVCVVKHERAGAGGGWRKRGQKKADTNRQNTHIHPLILLLNPDT
jgi:hypothetical protein